MLVAMSLEEQIRRDYEAGLSYRQLAKKYRKSFTQLARILHPERAEKEISVEKHETEKSKTGEKQGRTDSQSHNVSLIAMQMLDEGRTPIDVMLTLNIDVQTMKRILEDYRELTALSRPKKSALEYFVEIAKLFGERIRDACPEYVDEQGVCNEYSLYDIEPELRKMYPDLFKLFGGKTRFHVGNHPEICALCRRGVRKE